MFKNLFANRLLKHTFIYTLTDGISKALSFLILPFISFYLVPAEMGVVANFNVLQSILTLLAGQAIVNGIPYFYYKQTHKENALLISNLLLIIIVANILFSIVFFFINGFVFEYLQIGFALQLLTIISVLCTLVSSLDFILYRLEDKPISFAFLQITQTVLSLILVIIFVIVLRMQAIGKIYSIVISIGIMAGVHIFLLCKRGYIVFQYDRENINMLIKFGVPLLPHSLSFWLKGGMDKILLTTYCGLAANGIYSMALNFGAIFSIFTQAFANSYVPYLQKRINSFTIESVVAEKKRIVKMSYRVAWLFVILAVLATAFCWLIINYFLDSQYRSSFSYIPWIMSSLVLNSFYTLVVQFAYTAKKTFGLGLITFAGSIIQLLMTYILVRQDGTDGICYSLFVGSFIIMVGVWIYSNCVYPMPWFFNWFNKKQSIRKNSFKVLF